LDNPLAVQAMFPVTSSAEMAGQPGENPIADAGAVQHFAGPGGVWEQLAERLRAIPEYVDLFAAVFDDIQGPADITFAHAANAIAAFEASAWRCDNSRFDQYLRGDDQALTKQERRGMRLFYGTAGCAVCHSGTFATDQQFHSIAMVQIGPGKGDNQPGYADGQDDFGRERVTHKSADRFRFRTPSLRMVAQTGPWGHAGAYDSLEAVIRHHLDPAGALASYDPAQAVLPSRADLDARDFVVQNDPSRRAAIADSAELVPHPLEDEQIADLVAFLQSLTDLQCIDLRRNVPRSVPSGLPLAE
jgi:cytochrome c peroxidase